jgi:uncharacterized membrane protein
LILAAILRILLIGNHGLWLDELFSLKFASNNLQELIQDVALNDNHPPTYYILLHYWIALFGDSDISLRMPSVILSVLSVFFTYKVGTILFNRRVAAIAGLLLALSGFSIYYAQEARMYSLLAFTSVLSAYFLLRFLDKQTPWSLTNYVWSSTLLVYTHLYGLFVLVAENLYVLTVIYVYSDKDIGIRLKKWVSAQAYIGLLSLPWLVLLINRILVVDKEGFWTEAPTLNAILITFKTFSGANRGLVIWALLLILGMFYILIIRTALGRKVLNAPSSPGEGRSVYLLSLLLFIPILIPYLASQFVTPIYIVRCTIAGHFAFYLLVAFGITRIRWKYARYTALGIVLALSLKAIATEGYVHRKAAQVRQAVDYIGENIGKNDVVVTCGDAHLAWPLRYYAEKQKKSINIINVTEPDVNIALPELLEADQLWFVMRTDMMEWCNQFPQSISHKYIQTNMTETAFRKLELIILKKE